MNVEVRFFASLREATGVDRVELELEIGAGHSALLGALKSRLGLQAVQALTAENVKLAVNQELGAPPAAYAPGDEIAFLPPVTGG